VKPDNERSSKRPDAGTKETRCSGDVGSSDGPGGRRNKHIIEQGAVAINAYFYVLKGPWGGNIFSI
jgi:hypothetical protein